MFRNFASNFLFLRYYTNFRIAEFYDAMKYLSMKQEIRFTGMTWEGETVWK